MNKHWAVGVAISLALGSPVQSLFAADEPPAVDISKLDTEALREYCAKLQKRIDALEHEVAMLKTVKTETKGDSKTAAEESPGSSWIVKIESNTTPDTKTLASQLEAERTRLSGKQGGETRSTTYSDGYYYSSSSTSGSDCIEFRLNAAREKYTRMSAEKTSYWDSNNNKRREKNKYTESDLNEVKQAVDKLEGERRTSMQKISRLEAQIREAEQIRTASASLPDGSPVILRSTPASASLVADLVVGKKYRVSGVQVTSAKITTVTVKASALAE